MTAPAPRHAYLDWVRGVAVLIMVEAHALDSWTQAADRARPLFGYAMVLGGFGAPLFLFLAGVAAALSAESKFRKSGDLAASWRAAERRGWQIFGLAFLFRLQSYLLGGGSNPAGLLKVDILNIMGPAVALTAMAGRRAGRRVSRGVLLAAAAAAIAFLTPVVRETPLLGWLPDPVEWYFRPSPGRTNFTLFPWAGFVFAGAVVGLAIDALSRAGRARVLQAWLAAAGIGLAAGAYGASFLPSLYARSDFWTSSPAFFFLRLGILVAVIPAAFLWAKLWWRNKVSPWSPLQEFGRSSLFVYWVHVELAYGVFTRPLRRALSLEWAVAAYAIFTLFLFLLVVLKNRLRDAAPMYLADSKTVV